MAADYFEAQRQRGDAERTRCVARAIRLQRTRGGPMDVDALARRAIIFADNGTSYSEFIAGRSPEWFERIVAEFRAEVEEQLDDGRAA
jgi:hypothetical protein